MIPTVSAPDDDDDDDDPGDDALLLAHPAIAEAIIAATMAAVSFLCRALLLSIKPPIFLTRFACLLQ
jgi:hypothetical protein